MILSSNNLLFELNWQLVWGSTRVVIRLPNLNCLNLSNYFFGSWQLSFWFLTDRMQLRAQSSLRLLLNCIEIVFINLPGITTIRVFVITHVYRRVGCEICLVVFLRIHAKRILTFTTCRIDIAHACLSIFLVVDVLLWSFVRRWTFTIIFTGIEGLEIFSLYNLCEQMPLVALWVMSLFFIQISWVPISSNLSKVYIVYLFLIWFKNLLISSWRV